MSTERGHPAVPPGPRAVVVTVRVQPRASATAVVGMMGDAVRIRLHAPPVDGAANAELVRFLAERLAIPRSAVELLSGASARTKRLRITGPGFTTEGVVARLVGPGGA